MKLHKDLFLVLSLIWSVALFLAGYLTSQYFLYSAGLIPLALYEFVRTEGKRNTKPVSFLFIILLLLEFLHSYGIFSFPYDIKNVFTAIGVAIPPNVDAFLFLAAIISVFFSLTLIKYTWGSVTKFLAILLLAGSLVRGYSFWPEIYQMLQTPQGKQMVEGAKDRIFRNLIYRFNSEF